jgi:hypothetical protein
MVMESAEAWEPQVSEIIERLIAETEYLIEESHLIIRQIEEAKRALKSLAREGRLLNPD